jgi:hypothetical protein
MAALRRNYLRTHAAAHPALAAYARGVHIGKVLAIHHSHRHRTS